MVSTGTLWTKGSIETHPAPVHAFPALPGCARHKIWGFRSGRQLRKTHCLLLFPAGCPQSSGYHAEADDPFWTLMPVTETWLRSSSWFHWFLQTTKMKMEMCWLANGRMVWVQKRYPKAGNLNLASCETASSWQAVLALRPYLRLKNKVVGCKAGHHVTGPAFTIPFCSGGETNLLL